MEVIPFEISLLSLISYIQLPYLWVRLLSCRAAWKLFAIFLLLATKLVIRALVYLRKTAKTTSGKLLFLSDSKSRTVVLCLFFCAFNCYIVQNLFLEN